MPQIRKSWQARLITAIKIQAIIFLFAFLCFAEPGQDTTAKQAVPAKAKPTKAAADTAPAKPASKKKPDTATAKVAVHGRDTAAQKAAADTAPAKSASKKKPDTAAAKVAVHGRDTAAQKTAVPRDTAKQATPVAAAPKPDTAKQAVLPNAASKPDTAKLGAQGIKDTVPAVKASVDSPAKIAGSGMKVAEKKVSKTVRPGMWTPASKRKLLIILLVLLAAVVIIVGSANITVQKRQKQRFLTTTRLSVMDKEVQKACRYIEKNYANPELTAQSICAALVTGESFLEALMQRDLGISVEDFIAHVRVNRAKGLAEKDPTLGRVAAAQLTGFIDADAFDAEFKRVTGAAFEEYCRAQGKA